MAYVQELQAKGAKRRFRVRGRLLEPGWWAYEVVKGVRLKPPPLPPLSRQEVTRLAREYPRCAQRARSNHGGDSKVAWPNGELAQRVADVDGGSSYKCQLPAPAIGEHWHVTSKRRRQRRWG